MVTVAEAMENRVTKSWEKVVTDMNNVDETFANARDMGYTRLNYTRQTSIARLSKHYDSVDIYKTQVQSNGKLSVSLRDGTEGETVLDLSKYESTIKSLQMQTDPEGYKRQQEIEKKKQEENPLALTAEKLNLQVYMTKGNKQVLIADSTAEPGSKERIAMDQMLSGEYQAKKGDYYFKITRNEDTAEKNEEISYALQLSMGKNYKHDYVVKEQESEDTKNKKESKVPMMGSGDGLSAVNALQIQATKYQATAQMLQVGYMNMADIYSRNSKF